MRNDLKLEKTKSMDLSLALRDAEQELFQLQDDYDKEINAVSCKLLSLESSFLKEQKEIQEMLEGKDRIIEDLQEQVIKQDRELQQRNHELSEMKLQFEKELKARDKRIASQWRELETFKSANNKFLGALSQLRSSSLHTRSTSNVACVNNNEHKSLSPNTSRRKFRESSEWKEELSAFF